MNFATEKQIRYFESLPKKWERTHFGSGFQSDNQTRMIIHQIRRKIEENEPISKITLSNIINMLKSEI